jgi:DNA-binding NarL/FixJ family response regulator
VGCSPRRRLVEAVRGVFDGEVVLAPTVARRLVAEFTDRRQAAFFDPRVDRLSPREREVLVLAGRGMSNAEIAGQLWLSEATVKTHLARALTKLELRDRVAAVVFCHRTGMV